MEYESLPSICFNCGRFEHTRDVCPHASLGTETEENQDSMHGKNVPTLIKESVKVYERVEK